MAACRDGDIERVQKLVQLGININAPDEVLFSYFLFSHPSFIFILSCGDSLEELPCNAQLRMVICAW